MYNECGSLKSIDNSNRIYSCVRIYAYGLESNWIVKKSNEGSVSWRLPALFIGARTPSSPCSFLIKRF